MPATASVSPLLLSYFEGNVMNKTIIIANFFFQETGRYTPQFARPYVATGNTEALDNLSNRINDASRGADPSMTKISGSLVSGLSGYLVSPQASWEKVLTIPNGWDEQRLRFAMEVHVTDQFETAIYQFQGYSEYHAVTLSGIIDPNLLFYINSFTRINRARDYNGLSSAGYRDIVTESAQVVNGPLQSTVAQSDQVFGVRPEDVFVGIQSSHYSSALQGLNEGNVVDTRISLSNDVIRSRRANGIPSNYLSRVVENYRTASTLADFGSGSDDIYTRSIQVSHEASPFENPFIRALSDLKGMPNITYFTLNDLLAIDPHCSNNFNYNPVETAGVLSEVGMTDGWHKPDMETQLATIVSNAVPAMMIDHMFAQIAFTSTNMTIGGVYETTIVGGTGVSGMDLRPYYKAFIARFETEIMPDLTLNGLRIVHLLVNADLYGDTRIEISLEGSPAVPYIAPTFCDALTAPVVTTNPNLYNGLITGVESIIEHCTPTNYTDAVRNTLIANI